MGRYILRRIIVMVPVLLGVTMLTFIMAQLLPGDPAQELAGTYATPEQLQAVRERIGLDKPLHIQYVRYIGRLLQGDLGTSINSRQEISKELSFFYPATMELALAAMVLIIFIGIPVGVFTGSRRSPLLNNMVLLFALIGVGLPVFWSGLVFQLVFYRNLNVLPLGGRLSVNISPPPPVFRMYTIDAALAGQWDVFLDASQHLILPAVTLALGSVASIARITHSSMKSVMRNDYIRTSRAKGLHERRVINHHALRNALIPTITYVMMQMGWLLGGSILVENIYSWGGLGTYAWIGIFRLDIPVIMGITLVTTFTFMFLNLFADLSYAYLDRRISYD